MESQAAARAAGPAVTAEPTRTLTMTRLFDASPDRVFRAWTDPVQLGRWMGPRMIRRCEVAELNLRPGGSYRIVMHDEAGEIHTVAGVYREIAPAERLVFTWAFEGCEGVENQRGVETLITLTFRAVGAKTEMTLHQQGFATDATRNSHNHGWAGSFDKLAETLAAA